MDVYGGIDHLLDFSNEDLFSSSTSTAAATSSSPADLLPPPETPSFLPFNYPSDFSDSLSLPSDDVAELEWLSRFVDDSFTDFPTNLIAGTINVRSDAAFSGKPRTKRSRGGAATLTGMTQESEKPKPKKETNRAASPSSAAAGGGVRRCSHCASEKTPQWRTGPLGPKTLCNACGVRYKSGRLVPEYRPAASPTFVLTQHSNSHRKVMELRRQKEMLKQQQQQQQHHHHHQDFRVC